MRNLCSFSSNNTGNQLCFRFFILFIFRYCLMFYRSWTDRSVPTSVSLLFQLMWKIVHFIFVTGDTEMALELDTNLATVVSTATTEVFVLNAKNFDRLVTKKNPQTMRLLISSVCRVGGGVGVGGGGWEGGCVRVSVNVNERIPWSNMWWINLEATTVLYDTAMSPIVQQHLSTVFLGCGSLQSFISRPSL